MKHRQTPNLSPIPPVKERVVSLPEMDPVTSARAGAEAVRGPCPSPETPRKQWRSAIYQTLQTELGRLVLPPSPGAPAAGLQDGRVNVLSPAHRIVIVSGTGWVRSSGPCDVAHT